MGRIRTVKPDTFIHEELFDSEKETGLPLRLAYIGLWTQCDRDGRFLWRPRQLKTDILPYDDVDFSRVLDALWTRGFLVKYASDGNTYGCIPSWHKHQFINNKEKLSELPEATSENIVSIEQTNASGTREQRVEDACVTRPSPSYSLSPSSDSQQVKKEVVSGRARQLPPDWWPNETHFSEGERLGFNDTEVEGMAEDLRCWALGKGEARKNWDMVFSGWMRREKKNGKGHGPPAKEKHFRGVVREFLSEVDEKHGNGRRAICSASGGGRVVEFHAAAARLENHAGASDQGSSRAAKIDGVEDG
jgi:hypothetical protein